MTSSLSDLADALPAVRALWKRAPELQGVTNIERSYRRRGLELLETACAILQEVPQLRCIQVHFSSGNSFLAQALWTGEPITFAVGEKATQAAQAVQDGLRMMLTLRMGNPSSGGFGGFNIHQDMGPAHKQVPGMETWELTRQTLPEMFRPLVGSATWAALLQGELAHSLPSSSGVVSAIKPRM